MFGMDEELSYFTLPNGSDVGPPRGLQPLTALLLSIFWMKLWIHSWWERCAATVKSLIIRLAECWGKITKGFLRDESKCIERLHRTLPLDPNKKGSVRNSFPVHGIAHTQAIGVGIYFKSICLSCQTPTGRCKDKKKCFHFANLLLEILKVICCSYNLRSLLLPLYMWDILYMCLVLAQTRFQALVQPAQKEDPSILFSILQRVRKPEAEEETSGVMDKKAHTCWRWHIVKPPE